MSSLSLVPSPQPPTLKVAEFFAGIGLARLGLERAGFTVVWANDYEVSKQTMYEGHFGTEGHNFVLGDVATVNASALPQDLSLAWASFPCTDLSLAGSRKGLAGEQSGTFWQFTRILRELGTQRPSIVALENVNGLATSHGGDDITALVRELNELGYSVDILSLDGRRFVPQSRPRIFIVGSMYTPSEDTNRVSDLRPAWLQGIFEDPSLRTHRAAMPVPPPMMVDGLKRYVEQMAQEDNRWWDPERTRKFLASLSPIQKERLGLLQKQEQESFRTAYRRTRAGAPVWEIRSDEISGCLRTARGGSSKQAVLRAGKGQVQVRWMTPLEYARLMGAGDYKLDGLRDNQILFGFGDAVCVPAVEWVAENYLKPLASGALLPKGMLKGATA